MTPLVSVVIATYHRNELLAEAIESALAQTHEPCEVIVVDDSGTGHAAPVIEQYEDVQGIIRAENGGWGAAYTDGIRAASGDYVQLLDDDDTLLPRKVERCLEAVMEDPTAKVAYTGMHHDVEGVILPDPAVSGDVLPHALRFRTHPCCTITLFCERSVLAACLPLPDYADDLDLKIELAARSPFVAVAEPLVRRRSEVGRKWQGLAIVREMNAVLEHRTEYYEQYPRIHRATKAETLVREGEYHLEASWWSLRALSCFTLATLYTVNGRIRYAGRAIAAVFGRPGLQVLRWLHPGVGSR